MTRGAAGVGALFLGMVLLIASVSASARRQSPPATAARMLPDASCPAPCWNGIHTDTTSHAATVERIKTLPDAQQMGIIEWHFRLDDHPQRLRLERGRDLVFRSSGLQVGAIIAALGLPDFQVRGSAYDQATGISGTYVSLYYANQRVIYTAMLPAEKRLSPLAQIVQVIYPAGPFPQPVTAHTWQGWGWIDLYAAHPVASLPPLLVLE